MIRYATIGTSSITEAFIHSCKLTGEFELVGIYSRTYEKGRLFADKFGCRRVFTDLNDLAQDKGIDAVYIASPNIFHFSQSELMLKNKKHVICEKPAVTNSAELKNLIRIASQNRVVYMEAVKASHVPARKKMVDAIGNLGKISHARFDYSQFSSRYQDYLDGKNPNIFNPKMAAGTLMDIGIYCVYPAIDFFGIPKKITAAATFLTTGADGTGVAIFEYHDKLVELTYSKTGQGRIGSEIVGDQGTLTIQSISNLTDIRRTGINGATEILEGNVDKYKIMSGEAKSFANYILRMAEYRQEYDEITKLAVNVHDAMDEIRKQAGIKFQ